MRFLLPGFLGTPQDPIQAADLWEWGERFNAYAATCPPPRTLIGYSLGGRKALHAVLLNPSLWQTVRLLSTHPGLKTEEERKMRRTQDEVWAERFLHDPWEQLIADWNAQLVFAGSPPLTILEKDYKREVLFHDLTAYSLGRQEDLRPKIAALKQPIEWVTGALDTKFTAIAQEICALHDYSACVVLPAQGHRIASYPQ